MSRSVAARARNCDVSGTSIDLASLAADEINVCGLERAFTVVRTMRVAAVSAKAGRWRLARRISALEETVLSS